MSMAKQIYYHNIRENIKNMNPKLKELAIKAGAYPDEDTVLVGPMDVAKFAELIVRECAEVAGCNGHVSGFSLGDLIKEHFGVDHE